MRTLGVDVSHWEGRIDWQLARGSIRFAYFKCTDGFQYVDDEFQANLEGCREAGIAHAPYHYFQPALDPIAQAEHFVRTAGKGFKKYIVDVEQPEHVQNPGNKLLAFLTRVEKMTASRPAIYTSAGYWNEFVHPKPDWTSKYELIAAHYTIEHQPQLPSGWKEWRIWQFSDDWYFPGCSEQADADWFNGTPDACEAWFGNATPAGENQAEPVRMKFRSLFEELCIRQAPNVRGAAHRRAAQG